MSSYLPKKGRCSYTLKRKKSLWMGVLYFPCLVVDNMSLSGHFHPPLSLYEFMLQIFLLTSLEENVASEPKLQKEPIPSG